MINFNTEEVKNPISNLHKIEKWIRLILANEKKELGIINFIFCNDERILEINKQYLNHDYYTDIITFDYSKREQIAGDIFISLDTVLSNANELNIDFLEELYRVIIHGIFHLCRYNDINEEEQIQMREKENSALDILKSL